MRFLASQIRFEKRVSNHLLYLLWKIYHQVCQTQALSDPKIHLISLVFQYLRFDPAPLAEDYHLLFERLPLFERRVPHPLLLNFPDCEISWCTPLSPRWQYYGIPRPDPTVRRSFPIEHEAGMLSATYSKPLQLKV